MLKVIIISAYNALLILPLILMIIIKIFDKSRIMIAIRIWRKTMN